MLAWVRTGFAVAAILVIQLNPARIARFPLLSQISLFSFLAYSLAALYLTKKETIASRKIGLVTTCLDFLWVTLLVYSTGASRTPFFVFYLFPVITASSRWGIRGGLVASLIGVVLWGVVRFSPGWPNPLAIDTFIIRSIYLVVLGYIFGFISEFENRQNQRLMALNKTVAETATQEERRRIARELHDRLLQVLASLTLRLETCRRYLVQSPAELSQELQSMEEAARSSMVDIREFLAGKDSPSLAPGMLMDKLREEVRFLRDELGLRVIVESEPEELAISPEVEQQLYYVLREGLMNIARHAQASRAELFLKQKEKIIRGELKDDGVGFSIPSAGDRGNGLGLTTMRQRIEKLGGTLSIETAPGKGTRIQFSVAAG
jgi:signal transduction histidine kinase